MVPFLDWFESLPAKARAKCRIRLGRLAELGYELRRPEADCAPKHLTVNYRILYFFHGQGAVVLSHGFSQQRRGVPSREIEAAIRRRRAFASDPDVHRFVESE